MRIVAVIVTYNRLDTIKKTIIHTLAEPFSNVVVVDNASDDGSGEFLSQVDDARLIVLRNSKNIGGAGGFAQGMRFALDNCTPDWLVLYDDDAYPDTGALADFSAQVPDYADAVAAAVYYPNGRICEMNRPGFNPFWHWDKFWAMWRRGGIFSSVRARAGFHVRDDDYQSKQAVLVDSASFVGYFVRADVARALPLPDARLFIYGDDVLYTLKLVRNQRCNVFLPMVRFVHECSTFQQVQKVYTPLWKVYFTYRNGLMIYRFAAGKWFFLVLLIKMTWWLLATFHYSHKRRYLHLLVLAVWDGIRKNLSRDPLSIIKKFR